MITQITKADCTDNPLTLPSPQRGEDKDEGSRALIGVIIFQKSV